MKNTFLQNLPVILVAAVCLLSKAAFAQAPVTLTLEPQKSGIVIPPTFSGLSVETALALPDAGKYYFSPTNQRLMTLFRTLGIANLRVGGNTADRATVNIPNETDIDSLFTFAHALNLQVVYALRMKDADPQNDAKLAKYVLDHYKSNLACFAIGNEPNMYFATYPEYRDAWRKFMETITGPDGAPDAKFCGPSATPGKVIWSRDFATDFASTGRIAFVAQHSYPGGAGNKITDPAQGRDLMLSPAFTASYQKFYDSFVPATQAAKLPFRLEETNNFFNGGAQDVSNTFASALWGLDYMYWWASHGASGVNFHTGDRVAPRAPGKVNGYAVFSNTTEGFDVHPLAYGMKAFDLGSHGQLVPTNLKFEAQNLNMTAYSVSGTDGSLNVTLINKEHGNGAQSAVVTLKPGKNFTHGAVMLLEAPNSDVGATTGLTLGGESIKLDGSWNGNWTHLQTSKTPGLFTVNVPAASAAIVKFSSAPQG